MNRPRLAECARLCKLAFAFRAGLSGAFVTSVASPGSGHPEVTTICLASAPDLGLLRILPPPAAACCVVSPTLLPFSLPSA